MRRRSSFRCGIKRQVLNTGWLQLLPPPASIAEPLEHKDENYTHHPPKEEALVSVCPDISRLAVNGGQRAGTKRNTRSIAGSTCITDAGANL